MAILEKRFKDVAEYAAYLNGKPQPSNVLAVIVNEAGDDVEQISYATNNLDGSYMVYTCVGDQAYDELQRAYNTLEGQYQQLQNDYTTLDGQYQQALTSISTLEGQVSTLTNDLETANGTIASQAQTISTLQGQVTDLQGQITAADTALQAI